MFVYSKKDFFTHNEVKKLETEGGRKKITDDFSLQK